MSDNFIKAPWTPEQVEVLNRWQASEWVHPYTCAFRGMDGHMQYAEAHGQHDHGILKARPEGWLCPVCGYTQSTALVMSLRVEDFDLGAMLKAKGADILPRQPHERRREG